MKTSIGRIFPAFVSLVVFLNACAPAATQAAIPPTLAASPVPPPDTPAAATFTPSPIPPTVAPTATAGPLFTLECSPVKMELQGSRPPNVYGISGDFIGSGSPEVELLQVDIVGESGQFTADGNVNVALSADWVQVNVTVNDKWTYPDSKNVYQVSGKIVYDLPDVDKISSYDLRVSGGGFGTASQSCKKS